MVRYIVLFAAAVNMVASFAYIRETLRGRNRPNRMTWLLWSVAPLIATAAGVAKGASWEAIPVFMSGFCPLLVFLASFGNRKSYWELHVFDYVCGAFSILALTLWGITNEPGIAIVFALLSDLFAGIPTVVKSWKHPESESVVAYLSGFFNASTAFVAAETLTFASIAFPTYLLLMNGALIIGIERRRLVSETGGIAPFGCRSEPEMSRF